MMEEEWGVKGKEREQEKLLNCLTPVDVLGISKMIQLGKVTND